MPEEAWVVKCYSCKKFQAQLKKKAKKWKCVVCNSKQDFMKIYFKGKPADCRVNVQNLNAAEGEIYEKMQEEESRCEELSDDFGDADDFCSEPLHTQQGDNEQRFFGDEEFADDAILELEQQFRDDEEAYFENVGEANSNHSEHSHSQNDSSVRTSQTNFDDTIAKVTSTSKQGVKAVTTKLGSQKESATDSSPSIFESYGDLDETLDF